MNLIVIIIAAALCIIGLVITLLITKAEDTNYDSKQSISTQLFLYVGLIPIICIISILLWYFFV